MGEAVHLGVPMLAVPPERYFEQRLNARYLAKLGYGEYGDRLDARLIEEFLRRSPEYQRALAEYPSQDNRYLYQCIAELLDRIQRRYTPPVALSCAAIKAIGSEA
jgi:UDP:flavonoid glycosyltransferase YjiC (YdhE family)